MIHHHKPHILIQLVIIGIFFTLCILLVVVPRTLQAPMEGNMKEQDSRTSLSDTIELLTESAWQLHRFDTTNISNTLRKKAIVTFAVDGTVKGAFCNGFSGTYSLTSSKDGEGVATASDIISTKKYCAGPEMQAETLLFDALRSGAAFTVTTSTLIFTTGSNTEIEFGK